MDLLLLFLIIVLQDPEVMVSAMVEGRVPVGDNTLCIVCKTVSSFVREFVENNATKVCRK